MWYLIETQSTCLIILFYSCRLMEWERYMKSLAPHPWTPQWRSRQWTSWQSSYRIDHNLHAPFKAEGGVETVLKHLKLGLVRNDDAQVKNSVCFLISCQRTGKIDVLWCTPVLDNSLHCFTNVANDYLFTLKLRIWIFVTVVMLKKNWENRTWNTEPETVQAGHMIHKFCHL